MNRRRRRPRPARRIDREIFAANLVRILSGLTDGELDTFWAESRREYRGTAVERCMLEVIEGHAAWRKLVRSERRT